MKALSIVSIAALAIAGTACSQVSASDEAPEAAPEPTPVSAPADDGFNLAMPGAEASAAPVNDGFNLAMPSLGDAAVTDGFNLPTDMPATSGLDLPQIETAIVDDVVPAAEDEADDIIRLDP